MVLRDGGTELLEAEEGSWLHHVDMTIEYLWETVREGAESLSLSFRVDCGC
jgi:hypothetical protein